MVRGFPSFGAGIPNVPNVPNPPRGVNSGLPASLTPKNPVTKADGTTYSDMGEVGGVTTYKLENTKFDLENNTLNMKKDGDGKVTELNYTMKNGDEITFNYEGTERPTSVTRKKKASGDIGDPVPELETWDIKNNTYKNGKETIEVGEDVSGGTDLKGAEVGTPLNKVPMKDRITHIVKNAPAAINPKKLTSWLISKEGIWAVKTAVKLGLGAAAVYFLFNFLGGVVAAFGEFIDSIVKGATDAVDKTFNTAAKAICESEGKCIHCPGIDQEEGDSSDVVERAQATYSNDTVMGEAVDTGGVSKESEGDNQETDSTSECCSKDHPCVAEKREAMWAMFNSALILVVILAALGFLGVGPFKSWTGGGGGGGGGDGDASGGAGAIKVSIGTGGATEAAVVAAAASAAQAADSAQAAAAAVDASTSK